MRIQLRYYSRLRDLIGVGSEHVEVDSGSNVRDLVNAVLCRHSVIAPLGGSLLVARNDEFAGLDDLLKEGDRIDLMPPVSGG